MDGKSNETSYILTDEESNRLYIDEPRKFLHSYSSKKLVDKDLIVDTVQSIFRIQIDANIRLIRGVKIKCTAFSLPYFGALYQQRGSNFAVYRNNINHCLNIPKDRTPKEFNYMHDEWYFNIIRTCYGIANFGNTLLVFNCIISCTMIYLKLIYVPSEVKIMNVDILLHIMLLFLLGFGISVGDMARVNIDMKIVQISFGIMVFVSLGMVFQYSRLSHYQTREARNIFIKALEVEFASNISYTRLYTQWRHECCGVYSYIDWLNLNMTFPKHCCPPDVPVCSAAYAYSQGCLYTVLNLINFQISLFCLQSILVACSQIIPISIYFMYMVALKYGPRSDIRVDLNAYPLIENFYTIAKGHLENHLPVFLFYFEHASLKEADDNLLLAVLLSEINERLYDTGDVRTADPKFLFYALV